MSSQPQEQHKLWHLFSSAECPTKMATFLKGGLWCAELNSFPTFQGDIEGTQPFGIFVSCWHQSVDDPTPMAWRIFGNSGDGFALRVTSSSLRSLANQANTDFLNARLGQVQYVQPGQKITDAALQVAVTHAEEVEIRVALNLKNITVTDTVHRKEHLRKIAPVICTNTSELEHFRHITFIETDTDDAIVLPISTPDFIEEILIGPEVSAHTRRAFLSMLQRRSDALLAKVRDSKSDITSSLR